MEIGRGPLSRRRGHAPEGQTVPIAIEYYQGDGARKLRLAWRLPSEREAAARLAQAAQDLSVTTYLPQGVGWYDFWTNEHYAGGQRVTRQAPLDILPLYVRAGSIVPMGPVQHYATELPKAPYEIRIYPGADARFTVYEDDNETYDYEKGQYATYDLVWNDRARSLTISGRKGSFPALSSSGGSIWC
jgi:alpha-D-xyloside xylohydrolase